MKNKNKAKPETGSYANIYKQKLIESGQNKTSIFIDKEKKGINFDDLNDWVEIKFSQNEESNFQKEFQNNNIDSKQNSNIYGLLAQNNNINNNDYGLNNVNQYKLMNENKEKSDQNIIKNSIYNVNSQQNNQASNLNKNNNFKNPLVNHIPENYAINDYESNNFLKEQDNNHYYNINPDANLDHQIKRAKTNNFNPNLTNVNQKIDPLLNIKNNIEYKETTNYNNKNKENINETNPIKNSNIRDLDKNINNYHNRKNSKDDYLPNYPIRENDEFSINTSNFTNRYDLGNYGEKMDMSNLQNNNLAFKNQNIMINYTKDNVEDYTAGNNTIENENELIQNTRNEPQFSSNIKNQMANLTNKLNNIENKNNHIGSNNIQTIKENDSLDDEDFINNRLEDDLRNQYSSKNNNTNNLNYKEYFNKEKLANNFNIDKNNNFNKKNLEDEDFNNDNEDYELKNNLLVNNPQIHKLNSNEVFNKNKNYQQQINKNIETLNNKNNNLKELKKKSSNNENSDDDSDQESSEFQNEIDNNMNLTQNQLNDLKKEIYEINKQSKKQKGDSEKNNISPKKKINKNILESNQNMTGNANNTNFTEKTKLTNSTAKVDLNNNNKNQKIKRKPSPYLRNKESVVPEKVQTGNIVGYSKNIEPKNLININNNNQDLVSKPISIQTFQQNTNIMHIDPLVNPLPQMIYNMNTYNNNYANGYGNINLGYNPINFPGNFNNQITQPGMNLNPVVLANSNLNSNLPYGSLLPTMNYLGNLPNPVYGGLVSSNNNINNYYNDMNNINNNPNNNFSNDTNIQDSYLSKKPKADYKPYTIKDYKEKVNDIKKLEKLPRSLGANIGTKEWHEKAEKNKKAKDYGKNLANGAKKSSDNTILYKKDNENEFNSSNYKEEKNKGSLSTKNSDQKGIDYKYSIDKPLQVKDFYSNLKGIKEANDNEESFEDFEKKLERDLDNTKNGKIIKNPIKQINIIKNKSVEDSIDDYEPDLSDKDNFKIKKIQSGKSHIHNIINLKQTSDKNIIETKNYNDRNVNENAIISVDFKNNGPKEKNRPISTSKLDTNKNTNLIKNQKINTINNKNKESKSNKMNSNIGSDQNKIYTTLGTEKDFMTRLKPVNTSRINSSLNTTRNSRPISSRNHNSNVAKNINVLNNNKNNSKKNEIDELLQRHDLYYEKAQKIKNFMSKL